LCIVERGGRSVPCIACDQCGEVIETATDGNYEWAFDGPGKDQRAVMYFTHKKCCRDFESTNPDRLWLATELQLLPIYLANNLKWDCKQAAALAVFMDQFSNGIGPD
jgi:hypothetical protein